MSAYGKRVSKNPIFNKSDFREKASTTADENLVRINAKQDILSATNRLNANLIGDGSISNSTFNTISTSVDGKLPKPADLGSSAARLMKYEQSGIPNIAQVENISDVLTAGTNITFSGTTINATSSAQVYPVYAFVIVGDDIYDNYNYTSNKEAVRYDSILASSSTISNYGWNTTSYHYRFPVSGVYELNARLLYTYTNTDNRVMYLTLQTSTNGSSWTDQFFTGSFIVDSAGSPEYQTLTLAYVHNYTAGHYFRIVFDPYDSGGGTPSGSVFSRASSILIKKIDG